MGFRTRASTSATPTRPAHAVAAPPLAESPASRAPGPLSSTTPEPTPAAAAPGAPTRIPFVLNGEQVSADDGISLLDALRDELGCRSVKDGCSPQGQCGCCTVWVDGTPRVACVTPLRRVGGREVTTLEGLSDDLRTAWAEALVATGGSQCGFCTPGIVMRLATLGRSGRSPTATTEDQVDRALLAHLCRCTG